MPNETLSQTKSSTTEKATSFAKFWEDFKVVTQPYWYPAELRERAFLEVISSWGMLFLMIFLIVAVVAINGLGSFWNRYVLDIIIEERDLSKYYDTLWISCLFILVITLSIGFSQFVRKKVSLDWYKWLSKYLLKRYLSHRAYYKLDSNLNNPDQRLAQEIEPITSGGFSFVANVLEKLLEMTSFIIILATISQQIAIYLIVYTLAGNLVAIYLNQKLKKINSEELEAKANYNYCLTHLRNHTESIAFFQGEDQELKIIERRFDQVIDKAGSRVELERGQDIFNRAYQSAITIFSMFILTPLFIQDKIDYGEISQASLACFMFSNAAGILIVEWGNSGKIASYIERLANFSEMLKSLSKEPEPLKRITTLEENRLAFENLTLETPDYDKVIVEDLSLSVSPEQGLLIVGPSGRGKSSLLRAIAGLWNAGKGFLVRPSLQEILFLPQRPYIILGTLREQLLYPKTNHTISDGELKSILEQVNLGHLLDRVDNLDVELPWENVLSLGEQQRLAFARILVNSPNFTILDEATSALDLNNEANLYQQLQQNTATYISVGHRESLFNYHHWVLELLEDSHWKLLPMEDYKKQKNHLVNSSETNNNGEKTLTIKSPQSNDISETNADLNLTIQDNHSSEKTSIRHLSHEEMSSICDYAIGTLKNKGRQGQSISAKDGFIYQYHKKLRKWIRENE